MKEPEPIPLTNNPRSKKPHSFPMTTSCIYDIDMKDDLWIKTDENNNENNSQSIQQLESDQTN